MTRWAYVEASDLDPVDRVYEQEQVEDMASIATTILRSSGYSPEALLAFWERAGSDPQLQKKVQRLSREMLPQERQAIFEAVMSDIPATPGGDREAADVPVQTVNAGATDSI
jgi:hypothetical protein